MILSLLGEGQSAFLNARAASERRIAAGLERERYVYAIVLGGVLTWLGLYVSELSGTSAAMDRALGDEPSPFMLDWPMFGSGLSALAAVTVVIVWKGPAIASRMARLFGAKPSDMEGAIWTYLATLASGVIALVVAALDLAFGLALNVLPDATGWVPLIVAFLSLFVTLAISAHLAEAVLGISSRIRSLAFVSLWIVFMLVVIAAVWAPLYALLGGDVL